MCLQAKRAVFGSILVQREVVPVHKDGWNVATLSQHIKKSTSGNVATPQRRDVVTLQRRDVSASYSSQSLKAKGDQNSRGDRRSRNVRTRARKQEQQRHRSRKRVCDLYFSSFWPIELMFYILHIGIFLFSMF